MVYGGSKLLVVRGNFQTLLEQSIDRMLNFQSSRLLRMTRQQGCVSMQHLVQRAHEGDGNTSFAAVSYATACLIEVEHSVRLTAPAGSENFREQPTISNRHRPWPFIIRGQMLDSEIADHQSGGCYASDTVGCDLLQIFLKDQSVVL